MPGFLKKTTAILLLCALCVFALVGCKEVGSGHIDKTKVLKVGDTKITMDEYRYLCYKYRYAYDKGDPSYWDAHPGQEAKLYEDVLKELCAIYAVFELADEYDVKMEKEDKETLNSIISSYITRYGTEEAYLAAAREAHMTGDIVRREETFSILQEKLYAFLVEDIHSGVIRSDDAFVEGKIAEGEFYCVRYIMIQNRKTDPASLAQNRALAQSLRDRVAAGISMATAYREAMDALADLPDAQRLDPSYQLAAPQNMERGSYFIKGYLDEMAETAILATAEGAVTGVIEQEDYFCFYERVPCNDEYMQGEGFGSLRTMLQQQQFSVLCQNKAQELRTKIKFYRAYEGAFSVRES